MFNGSIGVELDSEGSIVSACTEQILKMLHHLSTHQGHNVPVSACSSSPPQCSTLSLTVLTINSVQCCTATLQIATVITSVMIYHHGVSLSEQHTDLLCTKQDVSHTSRYVDESSPEIARYRIRMPTARTATLSVTTHA